MRLYNTMSSRKEPFSVQNEARMYVCGPTPHARAHVGHAKSYISFDVLRRYLEWKGFPVRHVMCITDVAEEIVKKAEGDEDGFARRYEGLFFKDMARLGNLLPTISPRISENVGDIVKTVDGLVKGGHARIESNRIVLSMTGAQGSLSHVPLEEMVVEDDKGSGSLDVLLWNMDAEGRRWPSPWGAGRPGWHIQCYTMIKKYLGVPVDLHGGGLDLIFPHHESENMVSRILDGVDSSRFWVHNGLMMSGGRKMSKSMGGAANLSDALDKHGGGALRLLVLSQHYRENTMLSEDLLDEWAETAARLKPFLKSKSERREQLSEDAAAALEDDLHTEQVIKILLEEMDRAEKHDSNNVGPICRVLGLSDAEF